MACVIQNDDSPPGESWGFCGVQHDFRGADSIGDLGPMIEPAIDRCQPSYTRSPSRLARLGRASNLGQIAYLVNGSGIPIERAFHIAIGSLAEKRAILVPNTSLLLLGFDFRFE